MRATATFGSFHAFAELLLRYTRAMKHLLFPRVFVLPMAAGGSAELVDRFSGLHEVRCGPSVQTVSSLWSPFGLLVAGKSLQYRLGGRTTLTSLCHHLSGMTPLMAASSTALVASGACLDLRNSRNWHRGQRFWTFF